MDISHLDLNKEHTILVTGGAGFIGSNLCEALLDNGNKVTCLDNFSTGKRENIAHLQSNPNFKLIEGNLKFDELTIRDFANNSSDLSDSDPLTVNKKISIKSTTANKTYKILGQKIN